MTSRHWLSPSSKMSLPVQRCLSQFKDVMKWLWDAAAKPVLDAIDFSLYKPGKSGKPQVVWISTGWMAVFPIHAAGNYDSDFEQGPICTHDVVVSTYTSSIKALNYSREQAPLFP